MSLASLYNIPVDDPTLSQWAFNHMANHRDIVRIIYELTGIALPEFILDPFDTSDFKTWSYGHQEMHRQMNEILGIDGNDLLQVEWQDENQRASWILLQASEHRQACDLLGLG